MVPGKYINTRAINEFIFEYTKIFYFSRTYSKILTVIIFIVTSPVVANRMI